MIDALAARHGGTAFAAIQLAKNLGESNAVPSVSVITRADSLVARGLVGAERVQRIVVRAPPSLELVQRTAWEWSVLPRLARRHGFDAVVSMSGIVPRRPPSRVICLLFNPVMYETSGAANVLRRWAVTRTIRNADYAAAPSRSLAELVSYASRRDCAVVPLGLDHSVFTPAASAGSEVLCVADFYTHKRHDLLLQAWSLLPRPRPRLRFVGSGAVDSGAYARIRRQAAAFGDEVVLEGGLPLGRLVDTYRQARTLAIASEHESFCMPLAEAMACGVPGVVRDLASLRETGGGGATYVHGDDPGQWAAALEAVVGDDSLHSTTRDRAIAQAARFSWRAFSDAIEAQL